MCSANSAYFVFSAFPSRIGNQQNKVDTNKSQTCCVSLCMGDKLLTNYYRVTIVYLAIGNFSLNAALDQFASQAEEVDVTAAEGNGGGEEEAEEVSAAAPVGAEGDRRRRSRLRPFFQVVNGKVISAASSQQDAESGE